MSCVDLWLFLRKNSIYNLEPIGPAWFGLALGIMSDVEKMMETMEIKENRQIDTWYMYMTQATSSHERMKSLPAAWNAAKLLQGLSENIKTSALQPGRR
ncbi:hypothetical protein A1F94_006866 [Pyrenophora tritici-repentis]|nr:hypothetical protein A1F99_084370 [Pyrenophora tritici-repentis]KAG9382945.1 hypothetical protein A1F94_006866 [Pyrenophora tritici-repentis]KAI1510926.1 hypothetical protein Ptr86124_010047 [Pyrenophora tritici-repentis]KAI1680922.1 hypothetical protein KJE20_09773 [Pyrenophora tritici-repentis]